MQVSVARACQTGTLEVAWYLHCQGVHVDKPLPAGLCLDGRQPEAGLSEASVT